MLLSASAWKARSRLGKKAFSRPEVHGSISTQDGGVLAPAGGYGVDVEGVTGSSEARPSQLVARPVWQDGSPSGRSWRVLSLA
jgi:hypothetical protein